MSWEYKGDKSSCVCFRMCMCVCVLAVGFKDRRQAFEWDFIIQPTQIECFFSKRRDFKMKTLTC